MYRAVLSRTLRQFRTDFVASCRVMRRQRLQPSYTTGCIALAISRKKLRTQCSTKRLWQALSQPCSRLRCGLESRTEASSVGTRDEQCFQQLQRTIRTRTYLSSLLQIFSQRWIESSSVRTSLTSMKSLRSTAIRATSRCYRRTRFSTAISRCWLGYPSRARESA